MNKFIISYLQHFRNKQFVLSVITSIIFFVGSIVIAFYAINFAGTSASNSVTDFILSNTPVFNVDGIFVYGGIALVIFSTLVVLSKPRYIPFALKSIALFYIIRSGFVVLTHISPYPEHIAISSSYFTTSRLFKAFFTGDDLFFSAHTGLPFLLALIFWNKRLLRIIFIVASVIFGIIVLLGHLHYSIDVAAAFFIVPTIYNLAKRFFKKDWSLLEEHSQH
jgi:hypothetical protein